MTEAANVDLIFEEIKQEFGGIGLFWKALSKVPVILGSFWNEFKNVINSGDIPKETKLLITYECALADGCPRCREGFRELLKGMGIKEIILEKLEQNIQDVDLDQEIKNILVFAYHASKDPHKIEGQSATFKTLLGENKILETAAAMSSCKSIMDMAHYLGLHAFETIEKVP